MSLYFLSRHWGFRSYLLRCIFLRFGKAFVKSFPAADFGCTDTQEEGELIHQPRVRGT